MSTKLKGPRSRILKQNLVLARILTVIVYLIGSLAILAKAWME